MEINKNSNNSQHQWYQFPTPLKRQRLTEWIQKQYPSPCCIQQTHLNIKDRYHLGVKEWKKIFQANEPKNQASVSILVSDKIDFKLKLIRKDKDFTYS